MAQYIVAGNLGRHYVMRGGVLVPQTYHKYVLAPGVTHWMHTKSWNAAYKEADAAKIFPCDDPIHRNKFIHETQASAVRDMPVHGHA